MAKSFTRKSVEASITIGASLLLALAARAAETRLVKEMPKDGKINAVEFKKSKKPAWLCAKVKVGPKGNWNSVPNSPSAFFTVEPKEDPSVEESTKAVKCTLKIYDREKHRITNADLGETAE
jgi:hypothetical protein